MKETKHQSKSKELFLLRQELGKKNKDAERKLSLMGSKARPISFPKKAE